MILVRIQFFFFFHGHTWEWGGDCSVCVMVRDDLFFHAFMMHGNRYFDVQKHLISMGLIALWFRKNQTVHVLKWWQ